MSALQTKNKKINNFLSSVLASKTGKNKGPGFFINHDRFIHFIRFAHSVAATRRKACRLDSLDEQVPREYSMGS